MNAIDTVFEWLLAASLRASVLAVAILGIQLLLRRWLPAGWRHALWLPMLIVLVLPVLPTAPFGLLPLAGDKSIVVDLAGSKVATGASTMGEESVVSGKSATANAKLNYLALLWFAGVCGVLTVGAVGYRRNMILVKMNATSPGAALSSVIHDAAREAGLDSAPRVLVSSAVESPAVTGLLRPMLLLPAGFPLTFSAMETRLILLHEFSHLKRHDLPLNWLACVLQAMNWFNPLLWFAFARMRADRELACDARVLSLDSMDRRAEYGGALLKLQRVAPSRSMNLGFVGIFERGAEMKSRIREISLHRQRHFAGQVSGGAILMLLTIFGATKAQEASQNKPNGNIVKHADPVIAPGSGLAAAQLLSKLQKIVIPVVAFEDLSIEEAVGFLRQRSVELDVREFDKAKKGVNFVIRQPRRGADGKGTNEYARVTVKLQNVSMANAISAVAAEAGCVCQVDDFAVTYSPKIDAASLPAPGVPVLQNIKVEPKVLTGKTADEANKIIIPQVNFDDVTLQEAVNFLNIRAKELSKSGTVVALVIDPKVNATVRIKGLRLRNVPLAIAAKYCSDAAKLRLVAGEKEIRISGWK